MRKRMSAAVRATAYSCYGAKRLPASRSGASRATKEGRRVAKEKGSREKENHGLTGHKRQQRGSRHGVRWLDTALDRGGLTPPCRHVGWARPTNNTPNQAIALRIVTFVRACRPCGNPCMVGTVHNGTTWATEAHRITQKEGNHTLLPVRFCVFLRGSVAYPCRLT